MSENASDFVFPSSLMVEFSAQSEAGDSQCADIVLVSDRVMEHKERFFVFFQFQGSQPDPVPAVITIFDSGTDQFQNLKCPHQQQLYTVLQHMK